jgi:putative IMPACT (imprinted ancient) family translation regulator
VRAYGGGVAHALGTLATIERVDYVAISVSVEYGRLTALEQLLPSFEALVDGRRFDAGVTLDLRVPGHQADTFCQAVRDLTRGLAVIEQR